MKFGKKYCCQLHLLYYVLCDGYNGTCFQSCTLIMMIEFGTILKVHTVHNINNLIYFREGVVIPMSLSELLLLAVLANAEFCATASGTIMGKYWIFNPQCFLVAQLLMMCRYLLLHIKAQNEKKKKLFHHCQVLIMLS